MAQTAAVNGAGHRRRLHHNLYLGALGVVYGDIGTSPLYAVKQCVLSLGHITADNVYGVLSLIAWSLIIVVTLKYVSVIMRADNRGEGGILALTALALRAVAGRNRLHWLDPGGGTLGRLAVLRRRRHHPGDLGAERGGGAEGGDAAVRSLCHPDHAGLAGRRCSSCSAAAPRWSAGCSAR